MMRVVCINDSSWFGTKGKEYDVVNEGFKTLKDITCTGDDYTYEYYTVIDDCNEMVDIHTECFSI